MELYYTSEELVKLMEQRVQEETNDSYKSQYQILLQQQRNTSASLKSLAEARGDVVQTQSQQAQAKQSQEQAQSKAQQAQANAQEKVQQAKAKAQQSAQQSQQSANSYNQQSAGQSQVDTSSMTEAQKNATMNQRKEAGALDNDQKGSSNK